MGEVFEVDVVGVAEFDGAGGGVDAVGALEGLEDGPEVFGVAGQGSAAEVAEGLVFGDGPLSGGGHESCAWFVTEDAVEEGGHSDGAADVGAKSEG